MAEVERLLREFATAFEASGEANPRDFTEQLEGTDRAELEALIDAYLDRAPPRGWDASGFNQSNASQLADHLHASITGRSGLWPSLLPRLRDRARLKRSEVVERLARELGHPDATEKIAGYYHEMESGLLPSEGVSDKVLDALAGILDWAGERLRAAGRPFREGGAADGEAVFARAKPAEVMEMRLPEVEPEPKARDEIDELFRSGG